MDIGSAVRTDHPENNARRWVPSQGQLVGKSSKRVRCGEPNHIVIIPLSARTCERAKSLVFRFESSLADVEKRRVCRFFRSEFAGLSSPNGPNLPHRDESPTSGLVRIPARTRGVGKRWAANRGRRAAAEHEIMGCVRSNRIREPSPARAERQCRHSELESGGGSACGLFRRQRFNR
jgi:hypothetical protein